MPGRICLDTNIVIDILNGSAKVLHFLDPYEYVALPITVIGELRFGAYRSAKQSDNLVKIDALEMRCEIIEIGSIVADCYGSLKAFLVGKGTPIPENDLWIAACCVSINAPLLTNDRHFKDIPPLKTFFIK
jgi:tRNA(fMet)-specific endonuclease VapC